MTQISFWIVTLGIPMSVVVGNGLLRWHFRSPQSTAADLILALLVFDLLVVNQAAELAQFVRNEEFRRSLRAIYSLLIVGDVFAWVFIFLGLEKRLERIFDFSTGSYIRNPTLLLIGVYAISVLALFLNTAIFFYP